MNNIELDFVQTLLDQIRECEQIVHKWAPYIQFICAIGPKNDDDQAVYISVLIKEKTVCRPLFWIAGLMAHQTKGSVDDPVFESMLNAYRQYQRANEVPKPEALEPMDRVEHADFLDEIAQLRTLCVNINESIERHEWANPWFISYEYASEGGAHEFFSTNLRFTAYPALTTAMYYHPASSTRVFQRNHGTKWICRIPDDAPISVK
jgi:hypothetical protein